MTAAGSFEDVGEVLHVSRQRVQQIEEGSIRSVHENQPGMVARLSDFRAFEVRPWGVNLRGVPKLREEGGWGA